MRTCQVVEELDPALLSHENLPPPLYLVALALEGLVTCRLKELVTSCLKELVTSCRSKGS